ncbi:unnamed protein product [Clonostachys solani]|uniref:Methyltransferase n=1 Tax=Clonostachys solani TaxID=160281 RepID=A0A9N9ZC47_9HYPO|nr:unnamed protein product [Clonostachys solani]
MSDLVPGATDQSHTDGSGETVADPPQVEEVNNGNDHDSALGIVDDALTSESVHSSVYNYHMENGRRYHALSKGKYVLPNDEEEKQRLDIQNHQFSITFDGRSCFSPGADGARRVLDVGTGTGVWAIDFADEHPHATVIGVDLSPIQPEYVPVNCRFEVDDIENEWTWTEPFDFIFSRMMAGSFANWDNFMNEALFHSKPGGWLEVIDSSVPCRSDDGSLTEDHALHQWMSLMLKASENLGRSIAASNHHKQRFINAGLKNVTQRAYKWPTNPWPKDSKNKELGFWTLANIENGLEGISMALLTRGLGWTKEQLLPFLAVVRKDMRDPHIHAYWTILVTYGQKP